MKKLLAKLLPIILVLSMIMPSFTVFSSENQENTEDPTQEGVTWEDVLAGVATPYDYFGELDPATVPDAVGMETALSRVHIERLYEEETGLNDAVFLNPDGSKTMYMFDYPIKYIDDDGKIRDITLEIADSNLESAAFESIGGDAVTTFSMRASDGINLEGNGTSITMVPIIPQNYTRSTPNANSADSTARRIDRKTVSYYYDESTEIEYSLTYTGFKEDIVVNEYTGQTEYEFILYTDGNSLVCEDGSYFVVDENGKVKATVGDIIIITADNRNNTFGSIRSEVIEENEVYALTVVVDDEFLRDEKTAYPIRIDPTVEITYANNGAGAILDMTINSLDTSNGYSTTVHVGKRGVYGVSRILMKFPGLDLDDVLSSVNITEATVSIRDIMCQSEELNIECYAFTGNVWNEDTVGWTEANGSLYNTNLLYEMNVSYSAGTLQPSKHRYVFDITSAVKGWKTGVYDQEKGIIFKASDQIENGSTNIYKTFGSYNRESYQPMFSITYSDNDTSILQDDTYYLVNRHVVKYLRYVSGTTDTVVGTSGLLSSLQDSVKWELRKAEQGYLIRSADDTTKYLGVPGGSSSEVTVSTTINGSLPSAYYWDITTSSLGGMIIKNKYNGRYLYLSGTTVSTVSSYGTTDSETYASCTWRLASDLYYGNSSSNTKKELTNDFEITCDYVDVGEELNIEFNNIPTDTWLADESDFIYYTSSSILSIEDSTLTALTEGNTSVTATHKLTGLTKYFFVIIFPGTFDVYICASDAEFFDNLSYFPGHAWIEIVSHSAHNYTIGNYELVSGENVTIGRWGSQIDDETDGDFEGIWYNREIYAIGMQGKYEEYICSNVTVQKSTINHISYIILTTYDGHKWFTYNCVHFAVGVWNLCADTDERIEADIWNPNQLENEIDDLDNSYTVSAINIPNVITCGFYDGSEYITHTGYPDN